MTCEELADSGSHNGADEDARKEALLFNSTVTTGVQSGVEVSGPQRQKARVSNLTSPLRTGVTSEKSLSLSVPQSSPP